MPYHHSTALCALQLAATAPWRYWSHRTRVANGQVPVCIAFYHRVADRCPNPWTIQCRSFERQVRWLASRFDIVSLDEAQRRLRSGALHHPTACITFDDGYADNCEFAIPLLLRMRLPFTYFVTSGHIEQQLPFAHDIRVGVPLRPNSIDEIKSLAGAGVEIGAHSRTHPNLVKVSSALLEDEILGSRTELEQMTGNRVRHFAFPFGLLENLSREGMELAHRAGFASVSSAYGGYNWPGQPCFHLQRFHGDPCMIRFCNWLTIDPRKRSLQPPPWSLLDGDGASSGIRPSDERLAAPASVTGGVV